tara:strand:+ start:376 stop:1254 length:879 start_codon:yes stop_codon:yes gene_type:complete
MSKEIAKKDALILSEDQIALLTRTVANGCTPDEMQLFLYQCERTKLDPFSKQIHVIKRGDKITIQTGIDGYRAIAERTGKYAGNDEYTFDGGKKEWELIESGLKRPTVATSCIKKIVGGVICEFTASASWEEYCPSFGDFMWKKMPFLMLGKCAESLALRKAFPNDLSGIYTDDEMAQATNVDINSGVEVKTQAKAVDLKKKTAPKALPKKDEVKVEAKVEVKKEKKPDPGPERISKALEDEIRDALKSKFVDKLTVEKVEKWLSMDDKPLLTAANGCLDKLKKMIDEALPF